MIRITQPTKGNITIEIPYEEGEALLRAIGMTNTGDMRKYAPTTLSVIEGLVKEFGRNTAHEADRLMADIRGGQVRLMEAD